VLYADQLHPDGVAEEVAARVVVADRADDRNDVDRIGDGARAEGDGGEALPVLGPLGPGNGGDEGARVRRTALSGGERGAVDRRTTLPES
jgi:hypothetical protein